MVIHQFNKLIRNKWVWGVFAILVSAAFCFEDLFSTRDREERAQGSSGLLGGENVNASEFNSIAEDVRGLGKNRDWKRAASEVRHLNLVRAGHPVDVHRRAARRQGERRRGDSF